MVAGGGTTSYDLINIVGGMQKPLIDYKLIVPLDTRQVPNWAKDTYIQDYLSNGKPGFDFIVYKGQIYGVPSVLQGDSFAYQPDKTGKLDSCGALFDPKWRGYVALEDNYTTAGQKTALYLQKSGKAQINDPANMTPHEINAVVDFLIDLKKQGQFRVFWYSFQQAVNLITGQEVYVIGKALPGLLPLCGRGCRRAAWRVKVWWRSRPLPGSLREPTLGSEPKGRSLPQGGRGGVVALDHRSACVLIDGWHLRHLASNERWMPGGQ
jgi:Bacterial extracellular solute-binding protein